ncbi:hypothetical protein [Streptomyces longwoodensis]|uniref:hypothetical protein n=1 Tax=Streptomyces longwoodensis TaxID=68231 RepID=UPI0033EB3819
MATIQTGGVPSPAPFASTWPYDIRSSCPTVGHRPPGSESRTRSKRYCQESTMLPAFSSLA